MLPAIYIFLQMNVSVLSRSPATFKAQTARTLTQMLWLTLSQSSSRSRRVHRRLKLTGRKVGILLSQENMALLSYKVETPDCQSPGSWWIGGVCEWRRWSIQWKRWEFEWADVRTAFQSQQRRRLTLPGRWRVMLWSSSLYCPEGVVPHQLISLACYNNPKAVWQSILKRLGPGQVIKNRVTSNLCVWTSSWWHIQLHCTSVLHQTLSSNFHSWTPSAPLWFM